MNGEQRFLHNIVYKISSYSLGTRYPLDERDTVAQQCFVGGSIAGLGGDHPGRPPAINFRLSGRFCIHCHHSGCHRRSIHRSYGHIQFIEK